MAARIITITSGKGGVGKTTITANIGTALALLGHKVCLIDSDFGLRNLDIPLGLSNRIVWTLSDFMEGRCNIRQIIIKDKQLPTLSFIPCGMEEASAYSPRFFRDIVHEIALDYDFVLIDSPAGIENGFENAVYASDEAIVVTTPHMTAIQDADRVIGLLETKFGYIYTPCVIINMVREDERFSKSDVRIENVLDILGTKVLGIVHQDEEMIRAVKRGRPIALNPEIENGQRFRHIARNLIANKCEAFISVKKSEERVSSLKSRLFSWR